MSRYRLIHGHFTGFDPAFDVLRLILGRQHQHLHLAEFGNGDRVLVRQEKFFQLSIGGLHLAGKIFAMDINQPGLLVLIDTGLINTVLIETGGARRHQASIDFSLQDAQTRVYFHGKRVPVGGGDAGRD